jgi:multiple RNA-binding domain-containing protein 1
MLTPHRSSRLIIRNLAPTTTPASLREHLESPEQLKGCTITDIKVVAKRRFAFVGYKSAEEARKVKEWWEGAYLGGSKVRVEEVRDEVSRELRCDCGVGSRPEEEV